MANFTQGVLIQGRVKGEQGIGVTSMNVFQWWLYFYVPAGQVPQDDVRDTIVGVLHDIFYAIRDFLPGSTKWNEVELEYQASGETEWTPWCSVPLNYGGNDGADPLPSGVSAVLTGRTSQKKRRARKFLPPLSERGSDDQQWTVQALTSLAVAGMHWLTGRQVPTYEVWLYPIAMNMLSRLWTALTSVVVNAIPGYQRRRKPGVGI